MAYDLDAEPFSEAMLTNPYPAYKALRETDPVHWDPLRKSWLLTRYADCESTLRDEVHLSAGQGPPTSMLLSDPPRHTRLRSLVNKAFTPRMVRQLRPRVEQIVTDLLDRAAARGEIDLIADYAYPLPITVIGEMLGIDRERSAFFRVETTKIAISAGPSADPQASARADEGRRRLLAYFAELIARKRAEPQDDLITGMIQAEDRGDFLTHKEVMAMLILLLVGGHETTVNLIGNGMHALLTHPEQLERLRIEDGIERTAVDELLRFDSPSQYTGRVARTDFEIGGKTVHAGQRVRMMLAAANRDPEVFTDPETLDISRDPCHHLAFGYGVHFCLGSELARMEGEVAIPGLVRRFPKLRGTGAPLRWRPTPVFRGLQALPLVLN